MMRTLLLFWISFLYIHPLQAQQPQGVSLDSIFSEANTLYFVIRSESPFYMGNNMYVLHIGSNDYTYSKQQDSPEAGLITFFIPEQSFYLTEAGALLWLSYGRSPFIDPAPDDIENYCNQNPTKAWLLGKFDPNLLKK